MHNKDNGYYPQDNDRYIDSYISRGRYEFYSEWEDYVNPKEDDAFYIIIDELRNLGVYI